MAKNRWTKQDYPESMKNLPDEVREKAIEIANALLDEEDMPEGRAIAIATSQAQKSEGSTDKDTVYHVVPQEERWAVMKEDAKQASYMADTKDDAMERARDLMNKHDAILVVHKADGTVQQQINQK
ncbi:hypothetical protein N781_03175 [Pontibacillus halophilus JSM 076056 = DSM 19796]|uniref:DUF2188 domain-containing protein n=1 Tax=Pontibacillus halophilus JSM 076056 = DSM 19796 TaxID=1385510 RepID=A0A0A5I887_9BACI|nr:DUF2188 domain-containing protein [Pontibacillus halophilus]KGX92032.1 hypothetical protein N781_03175 [Pontibacillus halophilus JSM 076056 = DSM 19796]